MTKKLSESDFENIKKDIKNGTSIPQVAKAYNITKSHLYLLLRNEKENKKGLFQKIWEFLFNGK